MDFCVKIVRLMDERFMKEALKEAKKSYAMGEVPIGCVIVFEGKIVGRGHDTMETALDPTCHAEMTAIRKACRKLGRWRLWGCDMYVTTDPCGMCSGAIGLARLDNVYVGTRDGILADECSTIIKEFFRELRLRDKKLSEEKQ